MASPRDGGRLTRRQNLTYATPDAAVIKVDTTVGPDSQPNASTGRFSVRIESKKTYNKGLFIFDVRHTPYGCTTWPALWLTDPSNWPKHGEIDVLEAINAGDTGNLMTLHTDKGCTVGGRRKMTGRPLDTSCSAYANDNAGCGVQGPKGSFGPAFNQRQGGVMAVEWRDDGIRMWQFVRDAIPQDITAKTPTPDAWGAAAADFPNTHCDIGSRFSNNSIIANIDLCGDLVEATYKNSGCTSCLPLPTFSFSHPHSAPLPGTLVSSSNCLTEYTGGGTCSDFVATKPDEFVNAYWEFGAFEVYQAS